MKNSTLYLEDFKFLGNNILVKEHKEKSATGFEKPKQRDDKPQFGLVLSVGDKIEVDVKENDIILFGKYLSEQITINGEVYYFIKDEDVKGVLKKHGRGTKKN